MLGFLRDRLDGVESYFRRIEVLPLAMPALLDFQFHSPDAILVLDADISVPGRRLIRGLR